MGGQLRQFVPVAHRRVLRPDRRMAVVDVFGYQRERLLPAVELYPTVQLLCQLAQSLQPAVEARLKLRTAGHRHADAAQRVQRLYKARQHNLTVQTVIEALDEVAPELHVMAGVYVHTHDDLRASCLTEGMLDAVGNVRRQPHLRLQPHLRRAGLTLQLFQQAQTLLAVGRRLGVVIHHVQRHQSLTVTLTTHKERQVQQLRRYLRIFHADEDVLVLSPMSPMPPMPPIGPISPIRPRQHHLLRGMLGHHRRDDARHQNHQHHAVQHVVVH